MGVDFSGLFLAFTAGILTIFAPCSYTLLPGYISYYLGHDSSLNKAVIGSLVCTLGLMSIYSLMGVLSFTLGTLLNQIIPIMNILSGITLIVLGFATIREINIPYIQFSPKLSNRKGLAGFYLFGIVYGIAGIGCSATIFISIFVYSITGGLLNSILTFLLYATGMGIPLLITSILVSQTKDLIIGRIHVSTQSIHKYSGTILVIAGLYMLYSYYQTILV